VSVGVGDIASPMFMDCMGSMGDRVGVVDVIIVVWCSGSGNGSGSGSGSGA
jgi:hypothetical protein